jgi:hypothetical protein
MHINYKQFMNWNVHDSTPISLLENSVCTISHALFNFQLAGAEQSSTSKHSWHTDIVFLLTSTPIEPCLPHAGVVQTPRHRFNHSMSHDAATFQIEFRNMWQDFCNLLCIWHNTDMPDLSLSIPHWHCISQETSLFLCSFFLRTTFSWSCSYHITV